MQQVMALVAAGRLDEAKARLSRHVAAHGDDGDALRLLGKILLQQGDTAGALRHLGRAAALAPRQAEPQFEHGVAHLASGEPRRAAAAFRAALALQPDHDGARFNLAWSLRQLGERDEPLALLDELTRRQPGHAQAWYMLGNLRLDGGDLAGAVEAFTAALTIQPGFAAALANLGAAHQRLGQTDQAESALRRALALDPRQAAAANILANLLTAAGQFDQAEPLYRQALAVQPDDAATLCNLALALRQHGRPVEALDLLERAVTLAPTLAEAWNSLGLVCLDQDVLPEAERALAEALRLRPDFVDALSNMAIVLGARLRHGEAAVLLRRALALDPANAMVHSNLLQTLRHMPGLSRAEVFDEHRRYGATQEALATPLPPVPAIPAEAERRLRLGYVSPDLCEHAVAMFFEPVLRCHDRRLFEVFCYHTAPRGDATTERLKTLAAHWRNIAGLPPDQAAALIRADGIDILVDLAGHTRGNGLPIFARKPAPIQATWLGYPGTTGLTRMDYRITDEGTDPCGESEAFNTETLARLVSSAVFEPPPQCPEVTPLPALDHGHVRFGSFNRPMKITDEVIAAWSRILATVAGARLLLVVPGGEKPEIQDGFHQRFQRHGIAADRIEVVPRTTLAGFLDLVAGVDIALDPFPYSGGTTSFLTLWMGVPIIALRGDDAVAGVSAGLMSACDLPDLVAADTESYVAKACGLAADLGRLARLRATLRDCMARSSSASSANFTHCLEAEYRRWWRRYADPAGAAIAAAIAYPPQPELAATEPEEPPGFASVRGLEPPFLAHGGACWKLRLGDPAAGDDEDDRHRSPLVVLEDGRPLGPPHALLQQVADQGGGRYCHWQAWLYLSARDNSDPNTNGRGYAVAVPSPRRIPDEPDRRLLSDRVLVAVYDLAVEPVSYDLVWFLAEADLERRRLGLSGGHLVVAPGWGGGLRDEAPVYDSVLDLDRRQYRLQQLLLPLVGLFPAWTGVTVAATRHDAARLTGSALHLWPAAYQPLNPRPQHDRSPAHILAAARAGEEVRGLAAPPAVIERVAARLDELARGRRVISLTLRDYGFRPERNSDRAAWLAFAQGLDSDRYCPVWVPDTDTVLGPQPDLPHGAVMVEAAMDVHVRAALYQCSFLNLGINNGPMSLCYFMPDSRYLAFKMVNEAAAETSRAFLERRGVVLGRDFPFAGPHQHLVWEPDTLAVIRREFDAVTARISG